MNLQIYETFHFQEENNKKEKGNKKEQKKEKKQEVKEQIKPSANPEEVEKLKTEITKQGDKVRELKTSGAAKVW